MNFKDYQDKFDFILNNPQSELPEIYQDPDFIEYTKLNKSRMNRWLKTGVLLPETINKLNQIQEPQNWIVIAEPWCGDAAHILPFIEMMAKVNPLVSVSYELRDEPPFRIDNYLTNGSKSIPKVIVQDNNGNDIGVFGPRPAECHEFFMAEKAKNSDLAYLKAQLQKWYNEDKGVQIQKEFLAVL